MTDETEAAVIAGHTTSAWLENSEAIEVLVAAIGQAPASEPTEPDSDSASSPSM